VYVHHSASYHTYENIHFTHITQILMENLEKAIAAFKASENCLLQQVPCHA
jgi:hypothetical protein